jgi:hypothetical protein
MEDEPTQEDVWKLRWLAKGQEYPRGDAEMFFTYEAGDANTIIASLEDILSDNYPPQVKRKVKTLIHLMKLFREKWEGVDSGEEEQFDDNIAEES